MLNSNCNRTPLENSFCVQKQSFADVPLNKCSETFRKFDWKTSVLESIFSKVAGLQACNFVKKRLQHTCYLVKFAKFLRTRFFTEHLFTVTASLVLKIWGKFQPATIKKIPCWEATTLPRTSLQTFRWEFSETYKTIPQLFLLLS